MELCLGIALVGRVLIGALQFGLVRHSISRPQRWLRLFLLGELLGMAAVVGTTFFQAANLFPVVQTLYLIAVLAQGVGTLKHSGFAQAFEKTAARLRFSPPTPWFFVWLFLLGGLLGFIEPSWRRMTDHVLLDTPWEQV